MTFWLTVSAIGFVIAVIVLFSFRSDVLLWPIGIAWDEKWPPIDDEEFLRRCPPDTPREIAIGVRRIVAKHLNIPYEQIYPEQNFIEDLGAG